MLGIAMVVAIGWLAAIRAKRAWKSRKPRAAVIRGQQELASAQVRAFRELEREFGALGLGRYPTEPARTWVNRVAREGAALLAQDQIYSARAIVDALYRDRYAQ